MQSCDSEFINQFAVLCWISFAFGRLLVVLSIPFVRSSHFPRSHTVCIWLFVWHVYAQSYWLPCYTIFLWHTSFWNTGNLTKEAGPVNMNFTIPMYNASKLQVRPCTTKVCSLCASTNVIPDIFLSCSMIWYAGTASNTISFRYFHRILRPTRLTVSFPSAGQISSNCEEVQNIQSIQVGEIRDTGQLVCSSSMRTVFVQFFQRPFHPCSLCNYLGHASSFGRSVMCCNFIYSAIPTSLCSCSLTSFSIMFYFCNYAENTYRCLYYENE